MRIVVLDRETLGEDIDLSPICALGETVIYENSAPEELAAHIGDAEAVVLNKPRLSAEVLAQCPALRLICVAATGYDNIDTAWCKEHGVALYNVPGYSTDSVSQLTVSMVLSLATHLTEYRDHVHSGDYSASGVANLLSPVFHEVSAMTWGVVEELHKGCTYVIIG